MNETTIPVFRFLCFGAGAIGTYIGGSLALSGHKVVFLERSELAPQLIHSGMSITQDGQERRIDSPEIATSLEEALTMGPFDGAILAVKSFDTPALVATLAPYKMALPPILCFLNGVENEQVVSATLGPDKVISGSVTTAIGRRGLGQIQIERLRGIGIANETLLAPSLVAACTAAGLRAQLYENPRAMKWSKMLTNLLANASSAILDLSPAEIFAHAGLYRMEIEMLREALRVMRAQNIPVVDLPATPVRALEFMVSALPPALSQPLMRRTLGSGRGGKMPSFHIDLYKGTGKSEVDYLNGAVVRFGEKMGIPTPVNRVLNQTLLDLTCGKIALDSFAHQPEKLLERIQSAR
jgi:2-dehydropantoate 2-reductase